MKFGIILYALFSVCMYGADPEMWIAQLDNAVPTKTPAGQETYNIGFVLRACAKDATTQILNLYDALGFSVRNASGKTLEAEYTRDTTLSPTISDLVSLTQSTIRQRCYILFFRGDTLFIPDSTGGMFIYKNIQQGALYIDIIFDGSRQLADTANASFERQHLGENIKKIFRGTVKCGTLDIKVNELPKVP